MRSIPIGFVKQSRQRCKNALARTPLIFLAWECLPSLSDAAGKKHQKKVFGKSSLMGIGLFSSKVTKDLKYAKSTVEKTKEKTSIDRLIDSFTINGNTLNAEILWCLKMVVSQGSCN